MALRLRKSFISSFSLIKQRSFSVIPSSSSSLLLKPSPISSPAPTNPNFRIPSLSFRSSSISLSLRSNQIDDQKISPDTILSEGCDYNHWLITIDFPKDPKPTPEEMVETYVQTLAKVVGSTMKSLAKVLQRQCTEPLMSMKGLRLLGTRSSNLVNLQFTIGIEKGIDDIMVSLAARDGIDWIEYKRQLKKAGQWNVEVY